MPARRRAVLPGEDRREAILDAALDVFSSRGFSAARLEDVAARAGIAKGTVYLHFRSKQDLFEQLVIRTILPVIERMGALAADPEVSAREAVERLHGFFRAEVLGTRRKEVLRLVLSEGARFPAIAAFYHREVISRGLPVLRAIAARGVQRGELRTDALVRFPHLVIAPLLLCLAWDGLFAGIEPLDVEGLLATERDVLFGPDDPPHAGSAGGRE